MKIRNIFWDVDGVLADLNFAYFNFLKNHPNYRNEYKDLEWENLGEVLPINPKYGALELKTHPTKGEQMDKDFCNSSEFFNNRPLYPDVVDTLKELNQLGYRQFTMSATFDVETKSKLLNSLLAEVKDFLTIRCVQHGEFMHDTAKEDMLKDCFGEYNLDAKETILVDDRIYNQYAAINAGASPVRLRCEFTTDLPADISWIPELKTIREVKNWLIEQK
ncbi:MAG: FMN phosphatase YigB (HAD superfamily) [Zhongshania aliphaticivorans]|jgi:FMN phosphatase YigB (HAD superfamily)